MSGIPPLASPETTSCPPAACVGTDFLPELRLGLENLRAHKLRSLLTMLGMIFGVAAVVAMLSIGAGAQQEVMAFIEQLGVRNLIVEAREATDYQALQKVRKTSPGLTVPGLRVIQANLAGITASTRAQALHADEADAEAAAATRRSSTASVAGVQADRQPSVASGRFFDDAEDAAAAPVAVLGEGAAATLFGADDPVGRYVKVNEQWFRVIGVAGPQLTVQTDVAGIPAQDRNNLIYVPLYSSIFRLEDGQSAQKDEIDGIYLQMRRRRRHPGGGGAAARHPRRRAPRAPATSRSSRRRSCSPSSGARSGSSRW